MAQKIDPLESSSASTAIKQANIQLQKTMAQEMEMEVLVLHDLRSINSFLQEDCSLRVFNNLCGILQGGTLVFALGIGQENWQDTLVEQIQPRLKPNHHVHIKDEQRICIGRPVLPVNVNVLLPVNVNEEEDFEEGQQEGCNRIYARHEVFPVDVDKEADFEDDVEMGVGVDQNERQEGRQELGGSQDVDFEDDVEVGQQEERQELQVDQEDQNLEEYRTGAGIEEEGTQSSKMTRLEEPEVLLEVRTTNLEEINEFLIEGFQVQVYIDLEDGEEKQFLQIINIEGSQLVREISIGAEEQLEEDVPWESEKCWQRRLTSAVQPLLVPGKSFIVSEEYHRRILIVLSSTVQRLECGTIDTRRLEFGNLDALRIFNENLRPGFSIIEDERTGLVLLKVDEAAVQSEEDMAKWLSFDQCANCNPVPPEIVLCTFPAALALRSAYWRQVMRQYVHPLLRPNARPGFKYNLVGYDEQMRSAKTSGSLFLHAEEFVLYVDDSDDEQAADVRDEILLEEEQEEEQRAPEEKEERDDREKNQSSKAKKLLQRLCKESTKCSTTQRKISKKFLQKIMQNRKTKKTTTKDEH